MISYTVTLCCRFGLKGKVDVTVNIKVKDRLYQTLLGGEGSISPRVSHSKLGKAWVRG